MNQTTDHPNVVVISPATSCRNEAGPTDGT
jgi:hypothetical protein